MFRDAGMTNSVNFQQLPIDVSVLRVKVKNARAESPDVFNRVDELADQMARVPFDADVFGFDGVENAFPNRGLGEHVVTVDGQMPRALRTIFKGDANAVVGGVLRERKPEGKELREIIIERFANGISAAFVDLAFDHRAGETANGFHADVGGDINRAVKNSAGIFGLFRVERIFVIRADGRNADVAGLGFSGELFSGRFPVLMRWTHRAVGEAHHFNGAEAEALRPIQLRNFRSD